MAETAFYGTLQTVDGNEDQLESGEGTNFIWLRHGTEEYCTSHTSSIVLDSRDQLPTEAEESNATWKEWLELLLNV